MQTGCANASARTLDYHGLGLGLAISGAIHQIVQSRTYGNDAKSDGKVGLGLVWKQAQAPRLNIVFVCCCRSRVLPNFILRAHRDIAAEQKTQVWCFSPAASKPREAILLRRLQAVNTSIVGLKVSPRVVALVQELPCQPVKPIT